MLNNLTLFYFTYFKKRIANMYNLPSELLNKYNIPGPRYTSYPTVPFWETAPSIQTWINKLDKKCQESNAIEIYIHIPFCSSLCTYCGCHRVMAKNHKQDRPYLEALKNEWNFYLNNLKDIKIKRIHFGGGTPTFFSPEDLNELVKKTILNNCQTTDDFYGSFEADPRVTSIEHLQSLSEVGFTKISFGVQDFDEKVQKIINRRQSFDLVEKLTKSARKLGMDSVNFDLIYGLPGQSLETFTTTFDKVKKLRPDTIAFYSYAHVPWMENARAQKALEKHGIPQGTEKLALYQHGREMLSKVGYHEIGMDHFSLSTDPLYKAQENKTLYRNFMGYTIKASPVLIGLGASSISTSSDCFIQNEKNIDKYIASSLKGELTFFKGHTHSNEDIFIQSLIQNIMCKLEGDISDLSQYTSPEELQLIQEQLNIFEKDNLILKDGQIIKVTPLGRNFIRNIGMAFDLKLHRKNKNKNMFSQTV